MDNQSQVPSGFENGNSYSSHPSSSSQGMNLPFQAANPNMAHPASFYQDPFIQQQQQQYYYQYQQQHQPMMTPNSSYSAIHQPFPPPQFQHQYQYPTFPAPPPHYYPLATPPTSMQMNSSPYSVSLNSNPSSSMPHSRSSTTMLSSPSTNSNSNHSLHQFNPQPQPHLQQFSTPINYNRTSNSLPSTSSFPIPPPPSSSASRASVDSDLASASSKSASINKQISMGQTPVGKGQGSNDGDTGTSSEKKKRRITSKADTETLVALYNKNAYPDIGARELVALQTGMTPHSVAVWFANRRMTQRKLSARYAASGGQASGGSIPPSPTPTGHSSESGRNKVIHLSSENESVVDGGASLHPSSSTPLSEAARQGQGSASTSGSMASSASASAGKRKRGSEEQASPTFHLMPLSRQESRDEDVFSAPSSQPARPTVQLSKSSNVLTAAKPTSSSSISTPAQAPAPVKVVPSVRSISGPLGAERRPTQPSARSLQKSFSTGTNFSLLVTPDGRASIGSLIPTKGDEENTPVKLDDPSGTSSSSAVLAAFAAQASLDETSTSSIVCKEQDLNQEQASHTATPLWKRMQSSNQSSSEGDSPLRDPRGARGEEEDEEITLRKVANRRAAKARAQQEAQAQLRLGTNGTTPSSLPLRSADARSVQSAVSFKRPLRHSASLDLAAAHDRSLKPLSETMKAPQFKAPSSSLWRPSTSRAISRTVSQPLTAAKRGRPRKGEYSSNPQAQVKAQSKKKVVAAKPSLGKGKGKGKAAGGLARSQSYTVANGRPSRSTYMALDSNAGPLPSKPGSNLNPRRSVSSTAPFNPRTSLDTFALAQSSHGRYKPSSSRESAARTASWSADNRTASWSASAFTSSASNKNPQSIPPSSQSSSQLSDDWSNELVSDSRSFIKSSEFPPSSQEKTTVNGDSQPKDDSGFFGSDDESEVDELELESNQSFRRLPTYQSKDKVNNPFRDSDRHPSTREDPEQQENDHHAAQLLLGLGSWA